MARPKKEETEQAKPSETRQVTSSRKLTNLRKAARSAYKDTRAIAGSYGEQVRSAIEHDHLHRKAWSQAIKEDRMEPAELAEFYDQLEYYRDELGLRQRAESAPSLPLQEEEDNVEQFPDAAE